MQNEIQIDIEGSVRNAVVFPQATPQIDIDPAEVNAPVAKAPAVEPDGEETKLKRTELFAECARIVDGIETQRPESEHTRNFLQYRFDKGGVVPRKDTDPFDSSWFVMPNPDPENLLQTKTGGKLKDALLQASDGRIEQERMSRLMSKSLAALFRDSAALGAEGCTQADLSGKNFEQDVAPMLINGVLSDNILERIASNAYAERFADRKKERKKGVGPKDLPSDEDLLALAGQDASDIQKMIRYMSDTITGTGDPNEKAVAQALYRNIMQDSAFDVYASMMEKYDPEQLKKAAESWKKYMQQYTSELKGNANRLTSPDDMLSLAMIINAGNPAMLALYLFPILIPALLAGLSKWRELRNNKHLDETTALLSHRANALTSIEMLGVMSDSMSRSLSCGEDPAVVMKTMMEKLPELRRHYAELVRENFSIAAKYPQGKKLSNDEKNAIEQTISSKMAQMERVCESVGMGVDVSRIVAAVDKAHRLFFADGTWKTAIDTTSMTRLEKDLREAAVKAGAVPDPKNPNLLTQSGRLTKEYEEYQTFLERRNRAEKALEEIRMGLVTPGAVLKRPVSLETIRILSDGLATMPKEETEGDEDRENQISEDNEEKKTPEEINAAGIGTLLASALLEDASARKIDAVIANGGSEIDIKREIACSLAAEIRKEKTDKLSDAGFARGIALRAMIENDPEIMDEMGEMAKDVSEIIQGNVWNAMDNTGELRIKNKNYFNHTFAGEILRATMSTDLRRAEIAPRMRDIETLEQFNKITNYLHLDTESWGRNENKKTTDDEEEVKIHDNGYFSGTLRLCKSAGTFFREKLYRQARDPETIKNLSVVEQLFVSEEEAQERVEKRIEQNKRQMDNGESFFER